MEMMSIGMPASDCMRVAPLRNVPNSNAASTTPAGWLLPSSASAMLSNP